MLGTEGGLGHWMPGQPLSIAIAKGIHRRTGERIVRRNRTVWIEAENLAGEGIHLLRQAALGGITGGYIEFPVRPECHTAAVVELRAGNVVENDGLLAQRAFFLSIAHHAIDDRATAALCCIREIEPAVSREPWVQGYRHQAAFTDVKHVRNHCHWLWFKLTVLDHAQPPGPLGNENPAIGREG